jgi:hypothetical protein
MRPLAEFPALVAQFDLRRNRPITPETISYGSARKVWWTCPVGPDHRWEATPNARTCPNATGCPFCAGKRASVTNALARVAPALAAEWSRSKNGRNTPESTVAGTNRKAWWKCKRGHEWEAVVSSRLRGLGCPFCSRRRVSLGTSLAVLAPASAREWHPTRNGDLLPRQVAAKSNKTVWWKCPEGDDHEWQATVCERTESPNGRSACPFCSNRRLSKTNLLTLRCPDLAREWHPTKNGKLRPDAVTWRSMRRAFWRCARGHTWSTRIYQRGVLGTRCPYCTGRLITPERSLAKRAPATAKTWHPTKNGTLTPRDVMPGSLRIVWWKCPEGDDHEWACAVAARTVQKRCPFCAGRRVSKTNALSIRYPKIAGEWHPTKNGTLKPRDVVAGATRRVWWRCVSGHEWSAPIYKRTRDERGCPHCRRRKAPVATTRARRRQVLLAGYDGPQHGPVRRVR